MNTTANNAAASSVAHEIASQLDADGEGRLTPTTFGVKWVSDQNIDNGHETTLLVKEDGEVLGSVERIGADQFRAAACKNVRRFVGIDNAQAFVMRRLKEENPMTQFSVTAD